MKATRAATTQVAKKNGRNSRNGEKPAAFITIISESVASLLRVCDTAIISAIGAIIRTSAGITRLVMPRKVMMVWPWLVIRSMPRNACVIQITPVRLTRTSANDASVVRKIYLSIDPIAYRTIPPCTPEKRLPTNPLNRDPLGRAANPPAVYLLSTIPLIHQQNGRAVAPLSIRLIIHLLWPCGHGAAWQRGSLQAIVP